MSMTREEAIERYEGIRYTVACFTGSKKDCDAVDMAFSALNPVSREQVEKLFSGCINCHDKERLAKHIHCYPSFCPVCGKPLTVEAVDILRQRIKEAVDGETD